MGRVERTTRYVTLDQDNLNFYEKIIIKKSLHNKSSVLSVFILRLHESYFITARFIIEAGEQTK